MANPRAAVDAMAGLALTRHFMGKPDEANETIRLAQEYEEWTKASEKLFISDGTVKAHLKYIYQKLNVGKRREAVEKAKKMGIL